MNMDTDSPLQINYSDEDNLNCKKMFQRYDWSSTVGPPPHTKETIGRKINLQTKKKDNLALSTMCDHIKYFQW